jgi:hypothetical protein
MIIDYENQFVFLKAQKCGGTSAELYLRQFISAKSIGVPLDPKLEDYARELGVRKVTNRSIPLHAFEKVDWDRLKRLRNNQPVERNGGEKQKNRLCPARFRSLRYPTFKQHQGAESIAKFVGSRRWDNFLKVSVARNPFDRLVSWYFWDRWAQGSEEKNAGIKLLQESFGSWLVRRSTNLSIAARNVTHVRKLSQVDLWLKYEKFPSEIEEFAVRHFCIERPGAYKGFKEFRANSNERDPRFTTRELFAGNQRLIDVVLRDFSWDFEFHGYPIDL